MKRDLSALGEFLGPLLADLGVASLDILSELAENWDELAGSPWAGNSIPQVVRHGELLVEAQTASAVRLLRYAAETLAKGMAEHFGADVITSVRVVPPGRENR
jgi:hypothetical protein